MSAHAESSRTLADPSRQWRQLLTLSSLHRELLVKARSYRISIWVIALLVFVYGVRLLAGAVGGNSVKHAAVACSWAALIAVGAFFRESWQARNALAGLAALSGTPDQRDWLGLGLARMALIFKPLGWAHFALWSCWAWHLRSLHALPWLLLSFVASLLALAAFCLGTSALAHLSSLVSAAKPTRLLLALLLVPALLASVVPELPSLLDAHAAWLDASVALVELR